MYVSDWFDSDLFWANVPYALIGLAGIVFAIVLRNRLGRTATLLVAVGCGALVLGSVLVFPQMGFRRWVYEWADFRPGFVRVDVAGMIGRIRSTLGVLGLALILAAVFVQRPRP